MRVKLTLSEDTYWKLKEQATAHRMDLSQYVTTLVGGEPVLAYMEDDGGDDESIPDYDAIFAAEAAAKAAEVIAQKVQPKRKRK